MELKLYNQQGQETGTVSVSDEVFGREYNASLVHQLVVAYQANGRQGTRAQKTRGTVSHSTRKPWRQKGTGRARSGMGSSPIWRSGGRAHPSRPDENFSHKVNRKMYRAGVSAILSELVRQDRLRVVDAIVVAEPKTRAFMPIKEGLGLDRGLIVTGAVDDNLYLSSRNVAGVSVVGPLGMDPVRLVHANHVLLTADAVKMIEEWLA